MRSDRSIVIVWLVLVLVAAAYEAVVGQNIIDVGRRSADGAPGAAGLLLVAIGAVGLGGLVLLIAGFTAPLAERLGAVGEVALMPVAAAMLLLYHHLSFDPDYAPGLDRFSNGSAAPTAVVVAVCVIDLVAAGLLVARRLRAGLLLGGAGLVVSAVLTLLTSGVG